MAEKKEVFKAKGNKEMAERWLNDERMNALGVLVKSEINVRTLEGEITSVSEDKKIKKEDKEKKLNDLKDALSAEVERMGKGRKLLADIESLEKDVTKLWK